MAGRDIFLSHSSDDAEAARELRGILEADGYSCWMAPDDVIGTETWTEQILAAIRDCAATVVLVSHAANASVHVSREVNLALGRGKPVLPVRIEEVPPEGSLEYLLSLVQRFDAFPPPINAHRAALLRRLSTIAPTKSGVATPVPPPEPDPATGGPKPAPAPQPPAPQPPAPAPQPPAPQPPAPIGGTRGWIATNRPVAVIGGALALTVLVVGLAKVMNPSAPTPTATPGPTQVAATSVPVNQPPAGGVIRLSDEGGVDGVTTSRLVRVFVDTPPTGGPATKYLVSNFPVRPDVANALPYDETFEWTLEEKDGLAGERTAYVWFGDDHGGWSVTPVSATISFDNPPTTKPNLVYDRTGQDWCTDPGQSEKLELVQQLVVDRDIGQALTLQQLWTGDPDFAKGTDLSGNIDPTRQFVTIGFASPSSALRTFVDYFTVKDALGLEATGSFKLSVGFDGTCP